MTQTAHTSNPQLVSNPPVLCSRHPPPPSHRLRLVHAKSVLSHPLPPPISLHSPLCIALCSRHTPMWPVLFTLTPCLTRVVAMLSHSAPPPTLSSPPSHTPRTLPPPHSPLCIALCSRHTPMWPVLFTLTPCLTRVVAMLSHLPVSARSRGRSLRLSASFSRPGSCKHTHKYTS